MKHKMKKIISHSKADLILGGDFHLLETNPICRLDNLVETQWEKMQFIKDLQKEHGCPVLHSGDFFNRWKPSPWLLSKSIEFLPDKFYSVYGNHDLPQHSMELSGLCGLTTLEKAGKLTVFPFGHWKDNPSNHDLSFTVNGRNVFVWHKTVFTIKEQWMNGDASSAKRLLKKYPQFDLIVTGDNHIPFTEEYKGRLLVNPGSLFRLTAGQIDYKPRVYLWYSKTNTVEPVYIPIKKNVISKEHLEITEQRDKRIEEFVSSLNNDWDGGVSFEDNLKMFEQKNKVRQSVIEIVYKAIE